MTQPAPVAVSDHDLARRFVDGGADPLAYVESGEGAPLVAIHGALMTADDMVLGPMDALARHFRVVAVDRPGHGASVRSRPTDASSWRQAEIIHAAVTALGLVRPIVLGHSAGGAVALAYAMLFPDDTRGVVALAPICFPELRLEHVVFGPRAWPVAGAAIAAGCGASTDRLALPLLWRAMFLPQAMPSRFETAFPFAHAAATTIADGEDALALAADLVRSAAAYRTCRVPVRILGGEADVVINNNLHGRIAASLIPHATYRALPGLGHMAHHFAREPIIAAALDLANK